MYHQAQLLSYFRDLKALSIILIPRILAFRIKIKMLKILYALTVKIFYYFLSGIDFENHSRIDNKEFLELVIVILGRSLLEVKL